MIMNKKGENRRFGNLINFKDMFIIILSFKYYSIKD